MTASIDDVLAGRARWALVHGDCAEVLAVLPAKSVDHVITDPPYSEAVHSKSRSGRGLPDSDAFACRARRKVEFGFDHLTPELRGAVSKHAGRIARRWSLVFSDVESTHLWRDDLVAAGTEYVRTGIWIKEGCTPQFTGDRPAVAFEAVTIVHPKGRKRWNGGGKRGVWSVPIELDRGGHQRVDRIHSTQKPLELMMQLVADFTDPDDVIVDAFAGSFATGLACMRLGRRVIGIEADPANYAAALARMEAEDNGQTLHAVRNGQVPLFGKGAA